MRLNKYLMGFPSPRLPGTQEVEEKEEMVGLGQGRLGRQEVRSWSRVPQACTLTSASMTGWRGQCPSPHCLDVIGGGCPAHASTALSGACPGQAAAGT